MPTPAGPAEVTEFHRNSDVDSGVTAQHHTLGKSKNQAAPGTIHETIFEDTVIDGNYYSAETALSDLFIALGNMGADVNVTQISPPTGGGEQGPPGPTGPAGPKGDKGDPGTSITGPMGPQGVQGPPGEDGADSFVAGPPGMQGIPGVSGPPGETGPKGDKGDPGQQGIPGPQGPQGTIGVQGPQGPPGNQGQQGLPGTVGPMGPQGPLGPTGADSTVPGPTGPTGPKGDKGDKGDIGATGATGPQGPKGDPGVGAGAPVGTVVLWPFAAAPSGWLLCQGQTLNVDSYPLLGLLYGGSPGGTFVVTNMRGMVPVGYDAGGAPFNTLGGTLGALTDSHSHTSAAHDHSVPGHQHSIPAHAHPLNDSGWAQVYLGSGAGNTKARRLSSVSSYTPNVDGTLSSVGSGGAATTFGTALDGATANSAVINTGSGNAGNTGSTTPADTGLTGSSTVQPSRILNYIIKATP